MKKLSLLQPVGALLNERRLNKAAGAITALEEYIGGYLLAAFLMQRGAPKSFGKAMAGRSLEQYRQRIQT